MNLQEFLTSGLLESYALGQCAPAEAKTVEAMLSAHPAARRELEAIENALHQYANAVSVEPPAWMKGRIMEQISPATGGKTTSANKYAMPKTLGWALAISGGLLAAATWQLSAETRQQKEQLDRQELRLRDCAEREQAHQNLQQQIALLTHPATQTIELKWLDAAAQPDARAIVYTNASTRETYLGLAQLPALSATQDYQLWAIVDGASAPVPMEVFAPQTDASALRPMAFHENPQAYAVSIEPKGGSPNGLPTTVVMLGKAG